MELILQIIQKAIKSNTAFTQLLEPYDKIEMELELLNEFDYSLILVSISSEDFLFDNEETDNVYDFESGADINELNDCFLESIKELVKNGEKHLIDFKVKEFHQVKTEKQAA